MPVAGTYYVVDRSLRVVYAKYVNDGTGLTGFSPEFSPIVHAYSVYFLADSATGPTTRPAAAK
jgi:hypothetical protein